MTALRETATRTAAPRTGGGDSPDGDGLHDLAATGRTAARSWGRALDVLGPVVVLAAVIGGWQAAVDAGVIKSFVLPAPSSIVRAVLDQPGVYWRHTLRTTEEAMAAFAGGSAAAVLTAVVFVHSRLVERSVYPLTLAAQAIPVVALAPLLSIWLGPGMASKILVAGFLVFFPTLVNMQRGLRAVDPEIQQLMRSCNANWWHLLVKVRLPSSLPFLFVALKIGAGGCFLGALTAEWIGSDRGLGYLVTVFGSQFQIPQLWGAAIIASILAVCAFGLVSLVERSAMPWRAGRSLDQ